MKKAPPPPPPSKKKTGPMKSKPAPRKVKTFSVGAWTGDQEGEKVILYGASGRGKTTLGCLAPAPVFIGLDDGGRKIRHPVTGEPIQRIEGIETFDDFRDAVAQPALFEPFRSVVIDTGTYLERLAGDWTVENIPHEKGHFISRLVEYGYGKGYEHLFDTMRLAFQSLDTLIRSGKHVIILCQQCPVVVANASGSNYMEDGPKLYHPGPDSKQTFSIRLFACEWADHVFRLEYADRHISDDRKIKDSSTTERAIYIVPENPSYCAKSRTLGNLLDSDGDPITRISFESPEDGSLWTYLFPEEGGI